MQIAIVGTGYVGLVSGVCFAEMGNDVICVDINQDKIGSLKEGKSPIYEPGLDTLLERNIKEQRITFTTSLADAIKGTRIIFLALPTPPGKGGEADLQYVLDAAKDLSLLIKDYTVIVNKSTVPVGTAEKVAAVLAMQLDKSLFDVVSNPEFLREGVAVEDFLKPDRVVIGTHAEKAARLMEELYMPFVRQGNPIHLMDERSAEMTKYAANAYLAMRISFMNEMANLCEKAGADVDAVRTGIGSDKRIGKRFLFPGVGYGGSCFPKDVQALAQTATEHDYNFRIIKAVIEVNALQKTILGGKIKAYFGDDLNGKCFSIWGLAFKPETDDIREAPALELIKELRSAGATVRVFDPEAMDNVRRLLGEDGIFYAQDPYETLKGTDALVIVTEWAEFRNPRFEHIIQLLKSPVIFDGRNVYNLDRMKALGIHYESIGRPVINVPVPEVS